MTYSSTLLKFPDSTLAKYVKPEFDNRKEESEFIKIDRDGAQFALILSYMRDPINFLIAKLSSHEIKSLKTEADSYCLPEVVDICDSIVPQLTSRAVAITSNELMAVILLSSRKLAIVFDSRIDRLTMRQLIQCIDESKFDVYCYYEEGWFDGELSIYLYDSFIKACGRRINSIAKEDLFRFMMNIQTYIPL